jgi:pimeloyl-ACP methyl ester carboxylesterase
MPYLKTGILEIYYEISGQGEPVVLIGGLTSTILTWKYQQKELQKYYQVVLFDNRGSGRTRILKPQKLNMELFASDVHDLLKGLGIKKAHILGASMGGMIAQVFAHSYPECCISLILCCTACSLETGVKAHPEIIQLMLNREGISEEEAERQALQAVAHPSSFQKRKELLEFYLRTKLSFPHSADEIARRNEAIRAFDFCNKLSEITVPTLIMHGADDRLVPAGNAKILAQRIPDAGLILIQNSAHIFFIEEFEEFNRCLLDFMRRHIAIE